MVIVYKPFSQSIVNYNIDQSAPHSILPVEHSTTIMCL